MTRRVALLCFDNPYLPPAEGGKKVMLSHIEALATLDLSLDVYVFSKRSERLHYQPPSVPNRVKVREFGMELGWRAAFSPYPLCSIRRMTRDATRELAGQVYDVAIYEGEQMAPYRLRGLVHAKRHILYLHDIESEYRRQLALSSGSPLAGVAQRIESAKFAVMELSLREQFDEFLFISRDERDRYLPDAGTYCPYATPWIADEPIGTEGGPIVYIGDLSVSSNFESVRWFCDEVLPGLARDRGSEIQVRIIGRSSDQQKRILEASCGGGLVAALGYVDDLGQEYRRASCVIAPVLYGAGVKIKTIDALAQGQIVIGTSKTVEGTGLRSGEHVLVSDDPAQWAEICLEILSDRAKYLGLVARGLELLRRDHSQSRLRQVLADSMA